MNALSALKIDESALEALPPAERAIVADDLRALEEQYRENPLLGYHPHAKQVTFHAGPWPRTRLFIGGNRSGKTTSTHVDTIIQAVDSDVVPEHLKAFKRWEPPVFMRIVGPDLTRWLEGVSLQKFREWCPKGQLVGGGFGRGWDKQQLMLRFKNGSWIQFMSNDQDLEKFAGSALHRVVFDESPRQDIRRECLMRLIDYGGEELYGLTPMDGMSNWLFDDFYAPWESGTIDQKYVRLVLVDMDDNPHLADEDKEWSLSGLSPEERDARKTGRFIAFEGLVYPDWSKNVIPHVASIPEGVEIFCGIDPGIRHLAAVVYCYLDHGDNLVVFDEIALQGATVKQVCEEIHFRNTRWNIHPRWYVIDPASRNRNNQTGRSDQAEFSDNGVATIPGQNDKRAGINRTKERLAAGRLQIAANCTVLCSEFKKYRWQRESSRTEGAAREEPVKRDDHVLDALRYVVMQRPLAPDRDTERPSDTMKDRLLRHHLRRLRTPKRLPDSGMGPGQFA